MLRYLLKSLVLAFVLAELPSACPESLPVPAGPDQPVPPAFFGLHIHHAGSTTAWPEVPFAQWRLWDAYVAWPSLEPQRGRWRFETLDRYVALAERSGVGLLLPLGLTPAWASARPLEKSVYQPGNAAEPRDIEDWRNYVKTVATRYKGRIHEYEIWNEPNLKMFWTGDVDQMVLLTRAAAEVIHGIDPGATLVSPAATTTNGLPWLREFLAKGGGRDVDVVGYHFYVTPEAPERIVPLAAKVREIMRENGVQAKPLWNTESGWAGPKPFPSRELAGAYLLRAHLLAWSSGAERFYWYSWDNHSWVAVETTERDNRTLTPAGEAYRTTHAWLSGALLKECREDKSHTWTCLLLREGASEWIVWNPGGATTMELPRGESGARTITPLFGEARPLAGATLQIDEIPRLIRTLKR